MRSQIQSPLLRFYEWFSHLTGLARLSMRNFRTNSFHIAMRWTCILIACFSLPGSDQLILKHGTYVLQTSACKEQPFSAIRVWDGVGLSGPHTSRCITRMLSHRGNHFDVSTACTALGDGTPNPSGASHVEALSLVRLSNTRFLVSNGPTQKTTYRWCRAE